MDFLNISQMHFEDVCASVNGSLRVPLKKACHLLGISTQTAYNKRNDGTWDSNRLPILKDRGRLYVSCRDIARELARQTIENRSMTRRKGRSTIKEQQLASSLGITVSMLREQEVNQPHNL